MIRKIYEARMQLMTKSLERNIPPLYSQENKKPEDVMVMAHYFTPMGNMDWYATEYNPEEKLFFGWVNGEFPELGYFSLSEFEEVNAHSYVPKIERDMHWTPVSLKEVMDK